MYANETEVETNKSDTTKYPNFHRPSCPSKTPKTPMANISYSKGKPWRTAPLVLDVVAAGVDPDELGLVAEAEADVDAVLVVLSGPVKKKLPAMGGAKPTSDANIVMLKLVRTVDALTNEGATDVKSAGWTKRSTTYLLCIFFT